MTDKERLIYYVLLHGPRYDMDNHTVYNEIQNWCIGATVYNWMSEFEANEYGRVAWMALLQKYEGTESKNKHIILANQYILLHP